MKNNYNIIEYAEGDPSHVGNVYKHNQPSIQTGKTDRYYSFL